ncbi:MAG: gliding motility-associated C-terminal domain-containing protein [Bacteroidia bacterium]|nr:gliding motility-associated C-terminal domain-containing protein [Bacteroidia bacterium]
MKKTLLAVILALTLPALRAQTSAGTDFWVASTYPFYSGDSFYLAIASEKPTSAKMDIPLLGYEDSVSLGYNEIKYIKVPKSIRESYYYWYNGANPDVGSNGIHVSSKLPVRVYAFVDGRYYSCGATAVYPTKTQPPGGKYYPYKSRYYWSGGGGAYKNFFFSVVGIDDSVTVSFKTNYTTMWNMPPGNKIVLRKGQVVRIYTWILGNDPNLEVSAEQGKRIAVFTENFFDYAQSGCYQYDLMYEQILPSNVMGTDFILAPYMYHKKGYDYTIAAMDSNTIIKKDGKPIDTLNTGDTYYGRIYSDSSVIISADKPINLWEKNILDTCTSGGWGWWFSGPSIMTVSSNEQMITDATVSVPASGNFTDNYINIITTQFGKDSTWLDGNLIPANEFKSILNGNYYLYRDTILKGNHRLMNNYGFISYIYGRGQYGGYAYNASAGLQSLKRLIVSETYKSCDTGKVVKLTSTGDPAKNYQWTFGGMKDTGLTAYFQVPKEGTYALKLKYQLLRNNLWDSVITFLKIEGNNYLDFLKGEDLKVCKNSFTITLPKTKLFKYKWSNGDTTNTITTSSSAIFSLIVTNTATGCKFYDTTSITLFDKLNTDFTVSMARRCPGYPIFMDNISTVGKNDSIVKYQWYVDNLPDKTSRNDTVHYAYPGTYDLKVIITSKSGCVDSASKQIKVQDNPILVTGLRTYDSCYQRASFRFNSRSSLSVGRIVRYQWLFSDGDTTFKKVQAIKDFKDSGLYWAKFSAFSDAGCSDTTEPLYFKVWGAPSPQFNVTDSSVCTSGNYFTVDNTTLTHGQKVRYEWQWGDGTGETFEEPGFKNYSDTGKYRIGLVSAYTATNCSDTFWRTVQVLPNPKAVLTVDSFEYCLNRNYYHLNSNLSNDKGASVRYTTWKWGDNTQNDTAAFRKVYKTAGTFKVKMYFSTGKGCLDSAQKNLIVYNSPVAKFTITDSNICGSTNYYQLNNSSTAPNNAKWYWDYGDGNSSTVKSPANKTYSGYGDFTIALSVKDPLIGCTDTVKRKVTVLKGLALEPMPSDTDVCDIFSKISFVDRTKYGNLQPNRTWIFNNNSKDTSTADSLARTFNLPGKQQIMMIGGIPGTCADTVWFQVNVRYPDSVVSASHVVQYSCSPAIVDFTPKTKAGNKWDYYWDLGNSQIINAQNPTGVSVSTVGQNNITLTVKDDLGCEYTTQDMVEVFNPPQAQIDITSADTQCLLGNNFTFLPILSDTTNPVVFKWELAEGKTAATIAPIAQKYALTGNKPLSLSIVDKHGCRDTAFASIYLNESPTIGIVSDSACINENMLVNAQITPATVAVKQIDWYLNNTFSSSGNAFNFTSPAAGSWQLYAIVEAVGGCKDTSSNETLKAFDAPIAAFGADIKTATSNGVKVDFTDSSIGANSWTWYPDFPDRNINSNNKNLSYLYPRLGKVTAMLVVENNKGCRDSISKNYELISEELIFMPTSFTPNGDNFNDIFKPGGLSAVGLFEMSIYNRWGAKIFETTDPEKGWDGTYMGEAVPDGSYSYFVNLIFLTGKRGIIHGEVTIIK